MLWTCAYISTSPDDITGSWETRKRHFGVGGSSGEDGGSPALADDSNTRIYTHGSGENAPKTMPEQCLLQTEIENKAAAEAVKKRGTRLGGIGSESALEFLHSIHLKYINLCLEAASTSRTRQSSEKIS